MLKYLENESLEDLTKSGIVVVDFYANWCGPCKMLGPVLEDIASSRAEISVVKVDVDKHDTLAREFGIMSIPTIIIYKNGTLMKKLVGFMPEEALLDEINNI